MLGIIIALACLTTAVGTTSAVAQFFAGVFNNKIKYEWLVIGFCVFSAVISNFGVNTIIQFSGPILSVIYPIVVAMILLSIFTEKIQNDNVFRFAAYMALLVSILTLAGVPVMQKLPLASFGLNWLIPVIVAAIVGFFVPSKKKEAVKENILRILKEKYDVEEEDFLSAELEVVPAGKARDCGLDRSMVTGYGQDDRVCAYTSFLAMLEMKDPKRTACCLLTFWCLGCWRV